MAWNVLLDCSALVAETCQGLYVLNLKGLHHGCTILWNPSSTVLQVPVHKHRHQCMQLQYKGSRRVHIDLQCDK